MMDALTKRIHTIRILVVEDDSEMRDLLTDVLSDEGYEVTLAVDGSDAALKMSEHVFDLVITDMRMPKRGGLELLQDLRSACPNTPVILITAFGDWPTLIEAYDKGACDYINKPFKIEDLKRAVKKALQGKGG